MFQQEDFAEKFERKYSFNSYASDYSILQFIAMNFAYAVVLCVSRFWLLRLSRQLFEKFIGILLGERGRVDNSVNIWSWKIGKSRSTL